MPQTAAPASFKLVKLEGFPEPLLAKHVEDGRSGASHGPALEAELAAHDWDAAPCFVITRLPSHAQATSPPAAPTLDFAAASAVRERGSAIVSRGCDLERAGGAGDEFRSSWTCAQCWDSSALSSAPSKGAL